MKVKCEDCRFDLGREIKKGVGVRLLDLHCNYIKKRIVQYDGAQYWRSTIRYLNKEGTCSYYRRKWWKIWKPRKYVLEIFIKMEK